jgi:hypothetical protein
MRALTSALLLVLAFSAGAAAKQERTPMIAKATAVLFVEEIEKSLPFFEAAGFKRTVEVPHGGKLGFVILQNATAEVMLQSYASATDDVKTIDPKDIKASLTYLFVEVDDLAAVERALKPYPVVIPRRVTSYGATETGYREPSGHFVTFAQFAKEN